MSFVEKPETLLNENSTIVQNSSQLNGLSVFKVKIGKTKTLNDSKLTETSGHLKKRNFEF